MEPGLEGQTVTQASADFTVSLITDANYEVRIETDFSIHTPDGALHVSLGTDSVDQTTFQSLLRQKVTSSVAEDTGTLVLAFSDGTSVRVEPDNVYEAWTIAGPGGKKIVCMPGGELAVWSDPES